MKAISLISVVPVRTQPAEQAEQCTQLLFGELVEIVEEQGSWARIHAEADGYEGWVDRKMISVVADEAAQALREAEKATILMPVAMAVLETQGQRTSLLLTGGTQLPNYRNGRFELLGMSGQIDPGMVALKPALTTENLEKILPFYLNTPYLWGGRNAFGMDCSGFTQTIYRIFGIQLQRDAAQQAEEGTAVASLGEGEVGDLAFFSNEAGRITHVGMLLGKDKIMHCSGRVKVNAIDPDGIVQDDGKGYSHHLCCLRRYK